MVTSVAFHAFVLALLLLVPAKMLLPSRASKKEVDVVFYRPPKIEVKAPDVPPMAKEKTAGTPAPALKPRPKDTPGPDRPDRPELPPAPDVVEQQHEKVGKAGILAFKEKFASLAQDQNAPRLGADARYGAADDMGRSSSPSVLTTTTPGGSGGINVASLNRSVGGGGGGGGGGGSGRGGIGGVQVGRATSPIASIGGGTDRPKARGGVGPARTDEEIQIVFDRYKASFYRLYNRELRNNPTLKGQMVLRLTIETDGSVSMCVLHSSDMNAPDLAAQVVERVKTINFGAKEGVPAVTITYPIDFLPAG
jgi:hypothetical protein